MRARESITFPVPPLPNASAPIPKFASYRCTLACELRNQRSISQQLIDSSAAFEFEVPQYPNGSAEVGRWPGSSEVLQILGLKVAEASPWLRSPISWRSSAVRRPTSAHDSTH